MLAHNAVHAAFAGYTGVTVRPQADRAQGLLLAPLACVAARSTRALFACGSPAAAAAACELSTSSASV